MNLTQIIDIQLWNEARWRGAALGWAENVKPIFGLYFDNEAPARKIFNSWFHIIGHEDPKDIIRIAVIEGDIPGKDKGYTIHICPSDEFMEQNSKLDERHLLRISRMHRMNPAPDSQNLPNFKTAYEKFGECFLQLMTIQDGHPYFHRDLTIDKKRIVFRHVSEIQDKNDKDYVALSVG